MCATRGIRNYFPYGEEADFEAPSSDDVDELGRSRGSQVAPHTSSTSHGLRERGRGRWEQHGQKKSKVVIVTPPVFATSLKNTF